MIPEPTGGAHRDPGKMGKLLRAAILRHVDDLAAIPLDRLLARRYEKFRRFGHFLEEGPPERQALPSGITEPDAGAGERGICKADA